MSGQHDAFHQRGRRAVLAHEEIWESPPDLSSPRWGVTLVLRPDAGTAQRLDALASQVAHVAGPGHWTTGRFGSAHLTIRVLEPYRDPVPLDDPLVCRYAAAARRIAGRSPSPEFAMTGVVVALGGVLAAAEPRNDSAVGLRAVAADELGAEGHHEAASYRGDLWWSTLLHFAGPVADGAALVDWVEHRKTLDLGVFRPCSLDLVRYQHDGGATVPVVITSVRLEG